MQSPIKKSILLLMTVCLSLPAMADKASPASDYDKDPAQVFTSSQTVPVLNSNYNLDPTSLVSASVKEANGDAITLNYDPARFFDWQILIDLNKNAADTWQALVDCNNGNVDKAKAQYISGSFCREAADKMKFFFDSVNLFLLSSDMSAFQISKNITCADQDNCSERFQIAPNSTRGGLARDNYVNKLVDIAFGYMPNQKVDPSVATVKDLLAQFPGRNFHPLLIQVLLEHVSAGYPAHYGTTVCTSLNRSICVLTPKSRMPRIVLSTLDIRFLLARVPQFLQIAQFETTWATDNYYEKPLPPIAGTKQDSMQALVRKAYIAMRLLNHMSVGPMTCDNWGLWPKASTELLGIYALARLRHGDYIITGLYEENKDSQLLALRLSDTCNVGLGKRILVPESTDAAGGPDAAATIGAWRTLYNRH